MAIVRECGEEQPLEHLPLIHQWDGELRPLPVRVVRPAGINPAARQTNPATRLTNPAARPLGLEAPPWWRSGPRDRPFDFCSQVRRLCVDLVSRCESLYHVDVDRLLFAVTQARSGVTHGLQRVTPLRFHNGSLTRRRRGVAYQVQRYVVGGVEMLYLVTFCLPRFLDQSFDDKMITLFHELYHISPAFDGDLRRHEGRYAIHSHSKRAYDEHMADLARRYLANGAAPGLHDFLRLNFAQLQHRHGSVVGIVVPRPKLIPLVAEVGRAARKV